MSLQETLSPSTAICLHNLYFSSVSLRQRGVITPCDKRARLLLTPSRPRGHQQFMTLITPVKWHSTVHARFSVQSEPQDRWWLTLSCISGWAIGYATNQLVVMGLIKESTSNYYKPDKDVLKQKNDTKLWFEVKQSAFVKSSYKIPQMVLKSRIPTFKLQHKRYLLVVLSSLHVVLFVLVLALSPLLRLPYSAHLFCASHCPAHAVPRLDRSWVTTCRYANIASICVNPCYGRRR